MEFSINILVVLIVGLLYIRTAECLQCYQCLNTETKSGSSALKNIFNQKTDPNCASPSVMTDLPSISCTRSNQVCGFVETSATVSVPVLGSLTVKIQARDCMDAPEEITTPKCYDDSNEIIGAVKGILNLLLSMAYDTTVDGKACFCSTDLCSAGGCADGSVGIFGYCLEWYYLLLCIGAVLVLILIFTCCCCCCCRPCRSKKAPRGVVLSSAPGPVVYQTAPNGVAGMTNPGYNVVMT